MVPPGPWAASDLISTAAQDSDFPLSVLLCLSEVTMAFQPLSTADLSSLAILL